MSVTVLTLAAHLFYIHHSNISLSAVDYLRLNGFDVYWEEWRTLRCCQTRDVENSGLFKSHYATVLKPLFDSTVRNHVSRNNSGLLKFHYVIALLYSLFDNTGILYESRKASDLTLWDMMTYLNQSWEWNVGSLQGK